MSIKVSEKKRAKIKKEQLKKALQFIRKKTKHFNSRYKIK